MSAELRGMPDSPSVGSQFDRVAMPRSNPGGGESGGAGGESGGHVAPPPLDWLRLDMNAIASLAGLLAATIAGAHCDGITGDLVLICGGASNWGWGGGTTFGNVYVTSASVIDVLGSPNLVSHEDRHTWQWALFGPVLFPLAYEEQSVRSWSLTGSYACGNLFEMHAGLAKGGYSC